MPEDPKETTNTSDSNVKNDDALEYLEQAGAEFDVQDILSLYRDELSIIEPEEPITSIARRRSSFSSLPDEGVRRLSLDQKQGLDEASELVRTYLDSRPSIGASIRNSLRLSNSSLVSEGSAANAQFRLATGGRRLSGSFSQNGVFDDSMGLSNRSLNVSNRNLVSSINFLDLVRKTVREKHDSLFATWYGRDGKETDQYTFGELWQEAGEISYYLHDKQQLVKGDRVVLCYNFGLHFFASFLGCLRAGITAVLVYPPSLPLVKSLTKMLKVVNDCDAKLILTDSDVNILRKTDLLNPLSKSRSLWPKDIDFKDTTKLGGKKKFTFSFKRNKDEQAYDEETVSSDDIAFLQYTSGSTGDPKGVMVTFGALAADINMIHYSTYQSYRESGGIPDNIVGVSWLPQYHDLGLIHATIAPFAGGWSTHMMSPLDFIKNPLQWMDLISRHKACWGIAPDFAYRLVARKFTEAQDHKGVKIPIPDLNLSSVRYLQNAAEPIRLDTKQMFGDVFSKFGLVDDWFVSGYGLAENVVYVCYLHGYHLSHLRKGDQLPFIAVGSKETFPPSLNLRIVDPVTLREVEDGETGELWLAGPSVAAGYFNKPQLTEESFHAKIENAETDVNFLRTGDLAFFQDEKLFICGRIKDLVIVNGVNYYPQDIEAVVQESSSAVRPGCVACFSSNETSQDGSLEIVFEIRKENVENATEVCEAVRNAVMEKTGLMPARVVAIKERTISKTTSGKIRRRACRNNLHEDNLVIVFSLEKNIFIPSSDRLQNRSSDDDSSFKAQDFDGPKDLDAILCCVLGTGADHEQTWEDLGLSSTQTVELRNSIADSFAVDLPSDCFELYRTPNALKSFLDESQTRCLPVKLSRLSLAESWSISWLVMGALQGVAVTLLLLMFTASIIPAWCVGKWIADNATVGFEIHLSGTALVFKWSWLPVVIPVWMVTYSLGVVLLKWLVIGCYCEREISIPSLAYLRWWWVDRAVHVWENWIGLYIKGTPLIWLFYRLMGSHIHYSVTLDGFVREFDLVNIGEKASMEYPLLHCRTFGMNKNGNIRTLRFRSVDIKSLAVVHGMVGCGVTIGKGAFVEKLSVVPEGAQAPDGAFITGNPATQAGQAGVFAPLSWWKVGFLKAIWLIATLYLFFGLVLVSQIILNNSLPLAWRYTPLVYWSLTVMIPFILLLPVNIASKWVLIGRRRPGPFAQTAWQAAADWAVDLHFSMFWHTFGNLSVYSRIWNIVFWCYGLDIDLVSHIEPQIAPPSKLDLMQIRQSFISVSAFETEKDGSRHKTLVEMSSIGHSVVVAPGVHLQNTIVPPLSHITSDRVGEASDDQSLLSGPKVFKWQVLLLSLYALWMGLVLFSLVPAYEWCQWVIKSFQPGVALPLFSVALAVQTAIWYLLLRIIQQAALLGGQRTTPWSLELYHVYHTAIYNVQVHSFANLLWGTPLFNALQRYMGASVGKHVLWFGQTLREAPYVSIADNTIVDTALVAGHYAVYSKVTLGPVHVGGILHEGTVALANMTSKDNGSSPWRLSIYATSLADSSHTNFSSKPTAHLSSMMETTNEQFLSDDSMSRNSEEGISSMA